MYYSNLNNTGLNRYHKTIYVDKDFIDNTSLLTSDLWRHENIGHGIYRSYPLAYCETITTDNKNDKITENRLLIWNSNTERKTELQSPKSIGDLSNILLKMETVSSNVILSFYQRFNLDGFNHHKVCISDEDLIDATTLDSSDYIDLTGDGLYNFDNVTHNSFRSQGITNYEEITINNQNFTTLTKGIWIEISYTDETYLLLLGSE